MKKHEKIQLLCAAVGLMLLTAAMIVPEAERTIATDIMRLFAWMLAGYAVLIEVFREQAVP